MARWRYAALVLALIIGAVVWLGTASSVPTEKSRRPNDDWSRGAVVGQAGLNARVALTASGDGQRLHLAWVPAPGEGTPLVRHVLLTGSGRALRQTDVEAGGANPQRVTLSTAPGGGAHLMWVAGAEGARNLRYARLDGEGAMAAPMRVLAALGEPVTGLAMAPRPDGGVDGVYAVGEGPTAVLYRFALSEAGELAQPPSSLGVPGYDPALARDASGRLHLAWHQKPEYGRQELYYAVIAPSGGWAIEPTRLHGYPLPLGLVSDGPSIGLDANTVYVLWSLERRGGGLSQPSAEAYWLALTPECATEAGTPRRLTIPPENRPQYADGGHALAIRSLAAPGDGLPASFVYQVSAVPGVRDEMVAVLSVQLAGRTKSMMQVVLALWRSGELLGYQVAGLTDSISLRPQAVADARGHLYLCWIDTAGFGRYHVYLAGTAPEAQAELNRITTRDVWAMVAGIGWQAAQALAFFPIALVWMLPPIMLLALYAFLSADDDLTHLRTRLILALAAAVYTAVKLLFRPGWFTALPLPRWIPGWLADTALVATPLAITVLASVLTWLYVRRREYASLFAAFMVFAGGDALVTLLIYIPGVLAE